MSGPSTTYPIANWRAGAPLNTVRASMMAVIGMAASIKALIKYEAGMMPVRTAITNSGSIWGANPSVMKARKIKFHDQNKINAQLSLVVRLFGIVVIGLFSF
jgi:hypothetical protein